MTNRSVLAFDRHFGLTAKPVTVVTDRKSPVLADKDRPPASIIPIDRARKSSGGQAAGLQKSGPLEVSLGTHTCAIAVSGGKGGTGKSVVAANLAVASAMKGARTLALDADLGMADLNLLLGLAPGRSLLDVMQGCPIEDVLTEAHGIHVLPALNGSFSLANMDEVARHTLFSAIDSLDDRFDTLVIDTAPGIDDNSVNFAAAASEVIVVVTPESLSLADAYACLKALHNKAGVTRALVLPNKVRTPSQAEDLFERLSALVTRFLGVSLSLLPAVPWDNNMADAAENGVPVVLHNPDAPSSRAFHQVIRRLDSLAQPDDRQGGVRLFLRRTFTKREQEMGR